MTEESEVLTREASGRSDAGVVARDAGLANEDSLCIREFDQGRSALYAVADGLSGRNAGAVASAQAIGLLEEAMEAYARHGEALLQQLGPPLADLKAYVEYAVGRIDAQLKLNAEANPALSGMATTLSAAYVEDRSLLVVHVGDSRVYRARREDQGLQQLTVDDAPAPSEAFDPPPTRTLGGTDTLGLHVDEYRLQDGDILLLCTDGLWRELDAALIERILRGSPRPDQAVDRLIRAANAAGGRGNMAVIVVHIGKQNLKDDVGIDSAFPSPEPVTVTADHETPPEPPEPLQPSSEPGAEAEAQEVPPEAPVIPGPPAVPEVVDRATYPRPQEDAASERLRPRRQTGANAPEASSSPALFPLGMLAGIAFTLVLGGIVWGLRAWLARPAAEPAAEVATEETVEYDQIITHPVNFWAKPLGPDGRPCMVLYKSRHEETGEESWEELRRLQGTDQGPSGNVTLYREGDALHMFLDVQFVASEDGSPRGCLFSLKVLPQADGKGQTVVVPGPDAGEQRDGHIEVISSRPGSVTLVPQDPDELLLAGGKAEATMGGQVNASGYYVQHFDKIPMGTYLAKKGNSERIVEVTPAKRRVTVTFTE